MVEGVVRDDERRGLVLERQSAEIGDERLDVVHAVGGRRVVEALSSIRSEMSTATSSCTRGASASARSPVPAPRSTTQIVRAWLGELDDPIADREEGAAGGDLLPRLDAVVPAVRILAHGPYGSRSG